MLRVDQPSPSADGGLSIRCNPDRGPGIGVAPQSTSGPRTSSWTSAPASASSAALSSADCPAPTIATRRPAKTERSGCCAAWDSTPSAAGPPGERLSSSGGVYAYGMTPQATTTESVRSCSPEASCRSKSSPARVSEVTVSASTSGTWRSANQSP